jgi:hypothetical protein
MCTGQGEQRQGWLEHGWEQARCPHSATPTLLLVIVM